MKHHARDRETFILVTLASMLIFTLPTRQVSATTYEVGVKTNQWAKYTAVAGWDTTDASIPMQQFIQDARNTEWINITVKSIAQKNVTLTRTTLFKNNTQKTENIWTNVQTGEGSVNNTVLVVARDLNTGDSVFASPTALKIYEMKLSTYAGAQRYVNYANMTEYTQKGSAGYEFTWDKTSGFMTETRFYQELTTPEYRIFSSIIIKIKETNIWAPTTDSNPSPNLTLPFDTQLLVVGGGIVIAMILAAYAVFHKPKRSRGRRQRHP